MPRWLGFSVARAATGFSGVNDGATIIWHIVRIQDESPLTLHQAGQQRTDIANLESGPEVIL